MEVLLKEITGGISEAIPGDVSQKKNFTNFEKLLVQFFEKLLKKLLQDFLLNLMRNL